MAIKRPKQSFSHHLRDFEPTPTAQEREVNKMSWFSSIAKAALGVVTGVGKQAVVNAGVQVVEELVSAVDNVNREAMVGLSPSEVHAAEDAALQAIEAALTTMETLSVSLHYRGRITSDEVRSIRDMIRK